MVIYFNVNITFLINFVVFQSIRWKCYHVAQNFITQNSTENTFNNGEWSLYKLESNMEQLFKLCQKKWFAKGLVTRVWFAAEAGFFPSQPGPLNLLSNGYKGYLHDQKSETDQAPSPNNDVHNALFQRPVYTMMRCFGTVCHWISHNSILWHIYSSLFQPWFYALLTTQCAHVKKTKNKIRCGEVESEMVHCFLACAYMCVTTP